MIFRGLLFDTLEPQTAESIARQLIDTLNEAARIDPGWMALMIKTRHPSNEDLANYLDCCYLDDDRRPAVGLLGWLNAMLGPAPDGRGWICLKWHTDDGGSVCTFYLTTEPEPPCECGKSCESP